MITQEDLITLDEATYLAGFEIDVNGLQLINWQAGIETHVPVQLPNGMMAVYAFFLNGDCLKVGKAGPNSNARFQSQHYNPNSARSTLARSMLNDDQHFQDLNEANIGNWIKENTSRSNILITVDYGKNFMNFTEAFFILKYQPRYEG